MRGILKRVSRQIALKEYDMRNTAWSQIALSDKEVWADVWDDADHLAE